MSGVFEKLKLLHAEASAKTIERMQAVRDEFMLIPYPTDAETDEAKARVQQISDEFAELSARVADVLSGGYKALKEVTNALDRACGREPTPEPETWLRTIRKRIARLLARSP